MFLFKVDPCTNYTVLNETDGAQGNAWPPHLRDDRDLITGWYRFQGAAGERMPDKRVLLWICGTKHPGWLNGIHPTVADGVVAREICFTWLNFCCGRRLNSTVKNCTRFYVYKLINAAQFKQGHRYRYCGNAGAGKLH